MRNKVLASSLHRKGTCTMWAFHRVEEFSLAPVLHKYLSETYVAPALSLFMTVPRIHLVTGVRPWATPRNSVCGLHDQNEGYIQVTAVIMSAGIRKVQAVTKLRQAWLSFKWVIFCTVTLKVDRRKLPEYLCSSYKAYLSLSLHLLSLLSLWWKEHLELFIPSLSFSVFT